MDDDIDDIDEPVYQSLERCAHCQNVGAEFQLKDVPLKDVPLKDVLLKDVPLKDVPLKDVPLKDVPLKDAPLHDTPFFCHEDCHRAFSKQPTRASQIGSELFGESNLLVGYDLNTGAAGVCAQCIDAPIELSAQLMGHSIGVCSKECANELSAAMNAARIEASLVPHFIRRRLKHKTYHQRQLLAAAAFIWLRARGPANTPPLELPDDDKSTEASAPDDSAVALQMLDVYRAPMLDVFHVLGQVSAFDARDAPYFDARFWDSFARYGRCQADRAARATASEAFRVLGNEEVRTGVRTQMESAAFNMDSRKVAEVLFKAYLLYWHRYVHLHRMGGNEAIRRNDTDPELVGRNDPHVCVTRGKPQMTLAHDITKVYRKLTRLKFALPTREAQYVLTYGLFRDITPELPVLKGDGTYSNPQLEYIGSELGSSSVQNIAGIWDSLKRTFRSGKDSASFGKKYSSTTVTRLLYNMFLVETCMPKAEREARKLNYDTQVAPLVKQIVTVQGISQLNQLGFRDGTGRPPDAQLRAFLEFARRILEAKNQRSQDKGREGKDRSETRYAALCGAKGEYGKRHGTRFDQIADDLAKEVLGMLVYYSTGKAAKSSSKSGLSEHEKTLKSDLEGMFEDLRYRMGREKANSYLSQLFELTGTAAATLPVTTLSAPRPSTPKPVAEEEEEEAEIPAPPLPVRFSSPSPKKPAPPRPSSPTLAEGIAAARLKPAAASKPTTERVTLANNPQALAMLARRRQGVAPGDEAESGSEEEFDDEAPGPQKNVATSVVWWFNGDE